MDWKSGIGGLAQGVHQGVMTGLKLKEIQNQADYRKTMADIAGKHEEREQEKQGWARAVWQDDNSPGSVPLLKSMFEIPAQGDYLEKVGGAMGIIKNPGTPEATITKKDARTLRAMTKDPTVGIPLSRIAQDHWSKQLQNIDQQLKVNDIYPAMTPEQVEELQAQKTLATTNLVRAKAADDEMNKYLVSLKKETTVAPAGSTVIRGEQMITVPGKAEIILQGSSTDGRPVYQEKGKAGLFFADGKPYDGKLLPKVEKTTVEKEPSYQEKEFQDWEKKNPGKGRDDYRMLRESSAEGGMKAKPGQLDKDVEKELKALKDNPKNMRKSEDDLLQKATDNVNKRRAAQGLKPVGKDQRPRGDKQTTVHIVQKADGSTVARYPDGTEKPVVIKDGKVTWK